ncbi:MAG: DUF1294 domain-containing protein [Phycisphaerales bacterium]
MINAFGMVALGWLALWNAATFVVFAWDKFRAKSGAGRVPEKRLFLMIWLGGAVGAAIAMVLLRHKTRKPTFTLAVVFAFSVWVGLVGWFGTD